MTYCSNFSPKTLFKWLPVILLSPLLSAVQPADADANSVISAGELAAFVSVANSDSETIRRAVNIWKHGESYRSITAAATTYYVPAPASGRTFIAPATLAPQAAEPVVLYGLPVHPAGYSAYYYDTRVEDVVFETTVFVSEGDYRLLVPPHPLAAMEGGDLEFVIYPADASPTPANSYYTGTMSVQDLTPAPGTLSALRQKIDVLVAQIEQESGIDFSEYFAGGAKENGPFENELEQTMVLFVRYFQDPLFPGGLVELDEQIFDDSTPFLVDIRDQVDALLGRSDILQGIDEHGLSPPIPSGSSLAIHTSAPCLIAAAHTRSAEAELPPTDAKSLSELMFDQQVAAHQLDNFGFYGQETDVALTVGGMANAPAAVATAIPALTLSLMKRGDERKAYTYPALGWIEATFSETNFYADDCAVSGNWSATASATSLGWSTDGANLDLAVNLVGAAGTAGDALKYAKAADKGTAATDAATEAAVRTRKMNEFKLDLVDSGAEKIAIELAGQSSSKEVPPETWEGIEMTPDDATMKQVGNPVLAIDNATHTYTPSDIGTVNGYISPGNRQADVVFPPGMEASAPVTITVEQATLNLSGCPPETYTPGESYVLTAAVDGLREPDVPFVWNATAGAIIPVAGSVEGQEQAIWTAPDTPPSGIVTITALAEANICIPEGVPFPSDSCITQGSDYGLVLSPEETCYDTGDVVTLTLRNANDSSDHPETEFEVVSGTATIVDTGPNTAELTSNQTGEVGVVAQLVSDPNQLLTTTITFGCGEPMGLDLSPAKHGMQKLTFNTDARSWYTLFGSFSADNGVIRADFDAASTYQYHLAEDPEDPGPYGFVGIDPLDPGSPIINSNLSISLEIPYAVTSCGGPSYGIECLEALSVDENSVVIQGLSIDYELDPSLMGTRIADTYTIHLIPDNNSE